MKNIQKYKFKDGLPVEFEILKISELYRQHKNIVTTPHRTNFYHIIWIQSGSTTHYVDFNPINVTSNTILFVPKDCVNLFDSSGDYDGIAIIFTDDFFCKTTNDTKFLKGSILYNNLHEITQINIDQSTLELSNILKDMELELSKPHDSFQYDILRNLLHNFLLQSEREKQKQGYKEIKPSADLDYFLLFKDLLDKNFKTDKSVSKYASAISISEKRLNKATSQIIGKSPKQLIDDRVLLEAKRLLVHSSISIKEIAFELGFEEPTNFIKYFKKHNSTTLSEFREVYS